MLHQWDNRLISSVTLTKSHEFGWKFNHRRIKQIFDFIWIKVPHWRDGGNVLSSLLAAFGTSNRWCHLRRWGDHFPDDITSTFCQSAVHLNDAGGLAFIPPFCLQPEGSSHSSPVVEPLFSPHLTGEENWPFLLPLILIRPASCIFYC